MWDFAAERRVTPSFRAMPCFASRPLPLGAGGRTDYLTFYRGTQERGVLLLTKLFRTADGAAASPRVPWAPINSNMGCSMRNAMAKRSKCRPGPAGQPRYDDSSHIYGEAIIVAIAICAQQQAQAHVFVSK
eukprot:scaffold26215_cov107-Isochrysis_galbana.AAC.7